MEKIVEEKEIKEITKKYHEFYCDKCGEFLKREIENDDGFYPSPESYIIQVRISSNYFDTTRYKYESCLCENCREKINKEVQEKLLQYGFKMD